MDAFEPGFLLIAGALAIGVVYGGVSRLSGFCLRSAVIEVAENRPARQVAAWATARPVAILATQVMSGMGIIDLSSSIYLSSGLLWVSLGLGGFLFGLGMILTRGCGGRHTLAS